MRFLYPEFLWALSLIAIPIIIHLFNFRKYKTIIFSDLRFLREVKEETKRRSQLKHLLILLSRILTIVFLVLAFAQPFVPGTNNASGDDKTVVSFYLDNSFSMEAEGPSGELLETARQMIYTLADKCNHNTQYQLLTNELYGYQQRLLNKDELLTALDAVEISAQTRDFPEIYRRQADALSMSDAGSKLAFAFSDFQSTMLTDNVPQDSLNTYYGIVLESSGKGNVYLDSIWFESPVRQQNSTEKLLIRVVNTSDAAVDPNVILELNGARKKATARIEANTSGVTELSFINTKSGFQEGLLYIETDNELIYDDTLHFTFNVLESISVLEVGPNANSPFASIFGKSEGFNYSYFPQRQLELSALDKSNLVVLNGIQTISEGLASKLRAFAESGGSVAVFPGTNLDLKNVNAALARMGTNGYTRLDSASQDVKSLNIEHPFFENVFETYDEDINLPTTRKHYAISGAFDNTEENLFVFYDRSPFLAVYPVGAGSIYLSAVGLAPLFGNFKQHALFVTSALRMAELSYPSGNLFYTIGADAIPQIQDRNYNTEIPFELEGNGTRIVPLADRSTRGLIGLMTNSNEGEQNSLTAGTYNLLYDGNLINKLAFNYDRKESVREFTNSTHKLTPYLSKYNIENLSLKTPENIENITEIISENDSKSYWKVCLLLTLLFLAIEIALIKLWK